MTQTHIHHHSLHLHNYNQNPYRQHYSEHQNIIVILSSTP
jgi:hypothetical protein